VGEGAYIGMGAAVRDHVAIGAEALIGMGAVVVTDVAPGRRVLGVPAR
jgi:serine acetyltransferase